MTVSIGQINVWHMMVNVYSLKIHMSKIIFMNCSSENSILAIKILRSCWKQDLEITGGQIYHNQSSPDTIPEIHKCRHMLERGCRVCWGHHLGATLTSVSVMVSFPCIQLISICSEALGWSIGTIWPASWTYVLWHMMEPIFFKSEYKVTHTLWEREREREREREKPWGKWEAHGSLAILLLHHQLQMEQLGMPQTVFVLTIPWHEPTLNSLPKEKRN